MRSSIKDFFAASFASISVDSLRLCAVRCPQGTFIRNFYGEGFEVLFKILNFWIRGFKGIDSQ